MASVYKCPNCFMAMRYDVTTKRMVCDYCDSNFSVEEVEGIQERNESLQKADNLLGEDEGSMEVYTYICPNCGAEIMGDAQTAATFCNYCGNPTLNEAVLTKERRPSRIVPFLKTKEEAQQAFLAWGKKGILTPSDFTSSATIDKITGIYVPFWLYDVQADTVYNAKAEIKRRESNAKEDIEITEHYNVMRDTTTVFRAIPAGASNKVDDYMMQCMEPFPVKELVDFQMPYLSGFLADKYAYTDEEKKEGIDKRARDYAESATRDTITGYSTVSKESCDSKLKWLKTEYVMLPVWMLHYRYKEQDYVFAMNGQTGRVVGNRPVSQEKKVKLFLITWVIAFIVCLLVYFLFING